MQLTLHKLSQVTKATSPMIRMGHELPSHIQKIIDKGPPYTLADQQAMRAEITNTQNKMGELDAHHRAEISLVIAEAPAEVADELIRRRNIVKPVE